MGLADTVSQALGGSPLRRSGDQYAAMRSATTLSDAELSADNAGLQADLDSGAVPPQARAIMESEGHIPQSQPSAGGLADIVQKALSGGSGATVAAPSPIPAPSPQAQPKPVQAAGIHAPSLDPKIDPSALVGAGDAALTAVTGAIAQPVGAVAGLFKGLFGGKYGTPEGVRMNEATAKEVADSLTWQPRTEAGRQILSGVSDIVDKSKLAGLGPTEAISLGAISAAGPRAVGNAAKAGAPSPQLGSVGAAAVAPAEMARGIVAKASPELRQVVESTIKANAPITKDTLATLSRHAEADSLPVPVPLTKGQATQDLTMLSAEQNQRGKLPALGQRFQDQNKALIENTNAIREQAAPDVYATSMPEHGDMLIDAYKAKDAELSKDISAKYKALEDANGGQLPLDGKTLAANAEAELHKKLLFEHTPAAYKNFLENLKSGAPLNFEQFEALRTNLARTMRTAENGNERAAAGIIRNELEKLPMSEGTNGLKPLADAARTAARDRFALIESDPAYKAVVSGKASADKFIDKFILNADKKHVEALKANLAQDPQAAQVVASGVINSLKRKAGIIDNEGNFSQAGYNRELERIRPKLDLIFQPEQKRQIETLGNVARYTQAQPRGSFVNNSNTATALIADTGKSALEGAANVAAKGIPVGTWTRKILGNRAQQKALQETLEPGAGIRLRDIK